MIEQIRRFQEFLIELGVARSVLALPAPRTLAIEDGTSRDAGHTTLFSQAVVEPEIVNVSRDLFASGHYNLAVAEAFKALDKFVEAKAGTEKTGASGMRQAFSPKDPLLYWTERRTTSERDEQEGYDHIYAGAMLGIRNPTTHEFNWVDNDQLALELLIFAQHLLRKAKVAQKQSSVDGHA